MKTILTFMIALLFSMASQAEVCNFGNHSSYFNSKGEVQLVPVCYENVKNNSGGSLSSGALVVLDLTADDGVTVTTSRVEGARVHCALMETIADGATGKCQTYGVHSGIQFTAQGDADEDATAGANIYLDNNDDLFGKGKGLSGASLNTAANVAPVIDVQSIGVWLDTSSSTETVQAFIRLR